MATTATTVLPRPAASATTTSTVSSKFGRLFLAFIAFAVLVAVLGLAWYFWPTGDGIENGKEYALAYSYKAILKTSKGRLVGDGRVFDFADRNVPRTSIPVPLYDERGLLVRENSFLKPSTARKMRMRVMAKVVEGVEYPGYEYVVWEYNFSHVTNQTHIPVVIVKD